MSSTKTNAVNADMSGIEKIRKYVANSKILARTWNVRLDPYGMSMTLSLPMSDAFSDLQKMMDDEKVGELDIDPGDSVLRVAGGVITVTVKSEYDNISVFKAALHRWDAKIPPSFAMEASHKLLQRSREFQDLSDQMKSKSHIQLDSHMSKRVKFQSQINDIQSEVNKINDMIADDICRMVFEEKMLGAVTWQRPKGDGGVNIFRHDHCRELFPLVSLMGLVNSEDPTIRLGPKARIVMQMQFPKDRPKGRYEPLPVEPAIVAILHTGSFVEAADFVEHWGIKWEEPKEDQEKVDVAGK
jgi:hypothetical protein